MTIKKFNLAKGCWLFLLCVGIMLLGANHSQALPLKNTDIKWGGPIEQVYYNNNAQYWYTEYELYADEFGGYLDAFCVEYANADPGADYELVAVPVELANAALIADQFLNNGALWDKAAVQIAIWEAAFDEDFDLDNGLFKYNGGLKENVQAILDFIKNIENLIGPIMLAKSPPGEGSTGPSQDYLVSSVPDAAIMWLLGPAFIALGLLGRKKSKEYL